MPYEMLLALGIFAAAAIVLYSLTPSAYRYLALLAVSLGCMLWISGGGTIFLLFTALSTYGAGLIMDKMSAGVCLTGLEKAERKRLKAKLKRKKKVVVILYLIFNLGILLILKYYNYFSTLLTAAFSDKQPALLKIAVPLGLSYYTLQAMSYVLDVYRGKYPAERNLGKLTLFVAFFPQLHEGPFGRYDALIPEMTRGERIHLDDFYMALIRMIWGLFKIFMVANRAAMISDAVFGQYEQYGGFTIILGGIAFTLQLYAEFSGYIDIARGIGELFGIHLAKNFDMPFLAENVADFWRRWHISLGAFFRDYVFYPVSTSKWLRKLTGKMPSSVGDFLSVAVSMLTVWFLTGLWHGASNKYICYGLYYFLLIMGAQILTPVTDHILEKCHADRHTPWLQCFRILKTWVYVLIGMVMFRAQNMGVFFHMLVSLFTDGQSFAITQVLEIPDLVVLVLSVGVFVAGAVLKIRKVDLEQKYQALYPYQRYLCCFFLFCVVMVFGAYGLDYAAPDPIYGGF